MKKNNKDKSPKNDAIKLEPITSIKKTEQGGANPNFPEEYEEQLSTDIRMKPQPLVKPKKVGVKRW